jgi:ABC-type transport system involved in multi-copper enzyme maturation permease subunit
MLGELIRQEAVKLGTQRFPYVLVAAVLLLETAAALVTAHTPAETSLDVVHGALVFAVGAQAGLRGAIYLLLVVGAMSLAREFSLGTAKTFLVLPVSRRAWIAAKLIALALLALALVLAIAVLAALLAAIHPGWGAVRQEGLVLSSGAQVAQAAAAATGLTALLILPVCAFALLIGLHFTSSGAAVGVAILLGALLDAAANLVDGFGRYVFLAWIPKPFAQVERLAKGLSTGWSASAGWGVGVAAVSFGLLAGWAYLRFERMDIEG